MTSDRVIVDVVAGVLFPHPEPEHSKRWSLTTNEWDALDPAQQAAALAELNGRAAGYAALLMLQPDRFNWVKMEWCWV